jgi:hypothetical protein
VTPPSVTAAEPQPPAEGPKPAVVQPGEVKMPLEIDYPNMPKVPEEIQRPSPPIADEAKKPA